MTEKRDDGHLEPEVFVDLLDGVPVEASRRQHIDVCEHCRSELAELEATLSLLKTGESRDAPVPDARSARTLRPWLVAAAAVVLATSALYWMTRTPVQAPISTTELEALLPPVEQDEEFRLLLALTDAVEDWPPEEAVLFDADTVLELDELTPVERQRLVQELAEELRSSSL